MPVRIVYSDLDGTLLGPGGSLFTTERGDFTSKAADALLALHRAGVKLVLVSGRTQGQMSELARAVSASAYIAEMGALVVDRGVFPEEVHRNFGVHQGEATPFERMVRSGVGGFLLDANRGRLEPHAPWSQHAREATMLFRGEVDRDATQAALEAAGYDWVEILDNGVIPRSFPGLDVETVHAYHVGPKGVNKAAGVRRHLAMEGLDREDAAAIGDSRSDLELADEVGTMYVTANGRASIDDLPANATFTEGSHGEGFAEAVAVLLA
jgi:hydroxymethylpyrimidine pyrophosphatase-like HAD family hydrolase